MNKARLTITGNDIVGHRSTEDLLNKPNVANFDITVFCKEPRIACGRVHLSSYFFHHTAEELSLVREGFYEKHGIKALVGKHTVTINRQEKVTHSNARRIAFCDKLIMTIGSYLQVPLIKGSGTQDCFVYRTVEDPSAIESCVCRSKRDVVVGGGLLGLEATGALKNLGIETHIIKFAPMLMAEQPDQMNGEQLRREVESMGMRVHISKNTPEATQEGVEVHKTMRFANSSELEVGSIVFSTGIRPRGKLATQCGLDVAPHGDVVISDSCQTSDPDICAIGECVSWGNRVFGLVAPGYKMAQVAADHILGSENAPEDADLSAKPKLLGVDVGGIGGAHGRAPGTCDYVCLDESREVYKCLVAGEDNRTLLGAILTGGTSNYGNLLQLVLNVIEPPEGPGSLIPSVHLGSGRPSIGVDKLPDSTQICSCSNVTKGGLIAAINKGCHTVAVLKAEAKTGTGCGGYIPLVIQVLNAEPVKQGIEVNNNLCEHSAYSRQELFHSIHVEGIKIFEELLARHGKGYGYEVYKPTVGLLLVSCWNGYVLKSKHTPLQDSNDNFFADIQKDGTHSVILYSPDGKTTPKGLIAVGRIACEFNLYTKITGSQRSAMFGVQRDDLPEIWCQLTEADFETSRAYTKALRVMKICVGSTWCRYGVGDSVDLGAELENRYKGVRAPHKMKLSVSGCTCECSEAQGKDVGIIATEKGWDLYVCDNGGMESRHADLLAADIGRETLIKHLDRFTMFYIHTIDKPTCTVPWLESLEGGIDYLKMVITDDKLGLNAHLGEEMARLREVVVRERVETVSTSSTQTRFKCFISSDKHDPDMQMVSEREQHRPATPYGRIPVTPMEDNT